MILDLVSYVEKHLQDDNPRHFQILSKLLDVKKYYLYHYND